MLSNSYFDILPMSKSLITSKVFNLEVCSLEHLEFLRVLRTTPLGLLQISDLGWEL